VYGHPTADYWNDAFAGTGAISEDPKFAGGGDYHLNERSPCIGTGTDLGVAYDLDGTLREGFDMGCYEGEPAPSGTSFMIR
jgi:hypothetical protein